MKMMTMNELPGWVPPKHYDLLVRTVAGETQRCKAVQCRFRPHGEKRTV